MIQSLTFVWPFWKSDNDTERVQQKTVFIAPKCWHLKSNSRSVTLTLFDACLCRCTTGSVTLNAFTEWRWKNCLITASVHQKNGRPLPNSTFLHPFIKRSKCECPFSCRYRAVLRPLSQLCIGLQPRVCERDGDTVQTWASYVVCPSVCCTCCYKTLLPSVPTSCRFHFDINPFEEIWPAVFIYMVHNSCGKTR